MKMERKHFEGPRNLLQTKRQVFCVVFLSILKLGQLDPQLVTELKTGHFTLPLPVIEDLLQRQHGNVLWTILDLEDGFHQMPLT